MVTGNHLLGQIVAVLIGIMVDALKILPDAYRGLGVEVVHQHEDFLSRIAVREKFLRIDTGRGNGEEVGANIGHAPQ